MGSGQRKHEGEASWGERVVKGQDGSVVPANGQG